jgi:DNA polymerase III subunit epsilon
MRLKLTKPLICFDLETTGINTSNDRIVEISYIKTYPDERIEKKTYLLNPTISIPAGASAIHGIYDKDVADMPTFIEVGHEIAKTFKDCDFAGFNSNKFDIPLLAEEFYRYDIEFNWANCRFIDAQVIYHKKEPRNLEAAYRFYCDKTLENAHSSMADTQATYEVLISQLDKYEDLSSDVQTLSEFTKQNKNVDFAGRIIFDEKGVEVFNFGKHKGKAVELVFKTEPSFYSWMMNGDFARDTKQVITAIKLRSFGK